jgi:hypothetical protein
MRKDLVMVGIIMMLPLILTKFIRSLFFLLPLALIMFLIGIIILAVGVSTFTNIEKQED